MSKEIKTAIFALSGFGLFFIGFNYLKSNDVFVRDNIFYAVYDNAEGLMLGTPVTIQGFQVGTIDQISLLSGNKDIAVRFRVEKEYEFSKNSIAKIYEAGLLGGKSLAVDPKFDGADLAQSGDTLQSEIAPGLSELVNDKLTPLQEKIESMITHADSVLIAFNTVLDPDAQFQLKSAIENLNVSISNFRSIGETINNSLSENGQLHQTFDNLADLSADLSVVSSSLKEANLDDTFEDLGSAVGNLSQILDRMEEGEGSLGKLFTKDDLHLSLEQTNAQIQLLLEDMRLNPKRYVHFSLFGKKQVKYKPSDSQNE
ncbi:MAG: MCE family protein [Flavobacteriaceae bacterium TMED81]|nr:MAG: MCE family protein [Flavobacteriaceae bacterium TMED81]